MSVVEQRYHAVMEVAAGVPVTQVAARYGVSRQSVHAWVRKYERSGLPGLADRSHRPAWCPHRIAADVEAAVCELRRGHPGWGPRRLVHELTRQGVVPVPSRATVYRVLVRNGLVQPGLHKRRRSDYRRWEREAAMELWQMDIVGGLLLADGAECKVVTGIDDHSRFVVIAKVVRRATGRAVCLAFGEALLRFGVPGEVLTDNGKQFTARFGSGRPGETMFDRICRENGIIHRLTKPKSPTTTGKIERFHQTLRRELLDEHGPFADVTAAQQIVDEWLVDYNQARPHQALGMQAPAVRFSTKAAQAEAAVLPVKLPPSLQTIAGAEAPVVVPAARRQPAQEQTTARSWPLTGEEVGTIEVERTVPPSGNLSLSGQQIWFGPALAGTTVTLRIDVNRLHVLIGGARHKTLPSKLSGRDLRALLACGDARPAGPWADEPGPADTTAVEVDRTVNPVGYIGLGGDRCNIGWAFAGQRVTLRLDGTVMQVLDEQRILLAALPCPLSATACGRLRGARPAGPPPTIPPPAEQIAERTVSSVGGFVVAGQRIQIGRAYAHQVVTAHLDDSVIRVFHGDDLITTVPRTTAKGVVVRKSGEYNRRKIV
ncbi:IS481 family transposase [Streptomyces spinoverrucosus]|uniref:IS481 family transposase n=1 Tax=Streptomyces spinoverrucosus TaxID=284043 RepID=UPI0018C3CA17|nr:IS481 family transposase [Streptomyces spinoverrucosus]MBG0853701.1 IS481 family transposase [Streptomyces spinoverrucosus]